MSVQLSNQGIRLWCDERSRTPLLDFYTNAAPAGWGAASTQFEIALATRGVLADVSNLSSVRLDGVLYSNRDGTRLFSQTLAGSALNNALTLDTWEDGSQEHALFLFTQAQMNFIPSGTISITLWIVVTALTAGGEEIVCGTGTMTMTDPGAFTSAGSPPANPGAAISLGDADARYARIGIMSSMVAALGGMLPITNVATGTPFYLTIDGPDTAPTRSVQPTSFVLPAAFIFTPSYTGSAYLRSSVTGSVFAVCLDGPDSGPDLVILPASTVLPTNNLQIDSSGNIRLQNRTTGTFFALALNGPDSGPDIAIYP